MKKIMFNDKYGLTKAVLEGNKTMTRRLVSQHSFNNIDAGNHTFNSPYKVGEVIAIAQKYKDLYDAADLKHNDEVASAGWNNKMFVKAEHMPHHIRITDVHMEFLQNISLKDCLREGISQVGNHYGHDYYGPKGYGFVTFNTAFEAFRSLIDRTSGKETWGNNPPVWVYSFELVD